MSFIQTQCGGRMVRDPEVSYTNNGMAICKFSLPVDRPKKQGQAKAETDFFNFVAFGKTAEIIGNNYAKGQYILVKNCRPQSNDYTTKSGEKRRDIVFIVDSFEFTESKKASGENKSSAFDTMAEEPDIMF